MKRTAQLLAVLTAVVPLSACGPGSTSTTAVSTATGDVDWRRLMVLALEAQKAEKFEVAERHFLAAREAASRFGPDDRRRAETLYHLAEVQAARDAVTEAEDHFKEAIAVFERALGTDHVEVGRAANGLATFYYNHKKHDLAEPLFRRAIAISEKSGKRHEMERVYPLNNLAALCEAGGRLDEAEALYRKALELLDASGDARHPALAVTLGNYADLLRKLKRDAEATKLDERARLLQPGNGR